MTATDTTASRCPNCGHTFEDCTCTGADLVTAYITAGKQRLLTALEAPRA